MKISNYLYILASVFVVSCNLPDDTKDTLPKDEPNVDIQQLEKQVRDTYFQHSPADSTGHTGRNTSLQSTATEMNDWMKDLPDAALLSAINLPGTNESWNGYETDMTSTQSMTVAEQLKAGIRAFDIRCFNFRDVFLTYNSDTFLNRMFSEDIRFACIKFLQEHPTEFILMMITPKGPDLCCSRSFSETFNAYTKGVEKHFYLTENMPQVKDIREKIVILRHFENTTGKPLGNKIEYKDNSTYTSTTTITARIQDRYYLPTVFHRWGKWENILSMLNEADASGSESTALFLNFTDGYSPGCYPYTTAGYINPLIQKHLKERDHSHHHYGAIMMDYAGYYAPETIKMIAESNTQ